MKQGITPVLVALAFLVLLGGASFWLWDYQEQPAMGPDPAGFAPPPVLFPVDEASYEVEIAIVEAKFASEKAVTDSRKKPKIEYTVD